METKWRWNDEEAIRIGTQNSDGSVAWRYGSVGYPFPGIKVYLGAPLHEGAPYHIRIERDNHRQLLDTFHLHCQDDQEFGVQASSLDEAKKKAPAAIKKALRYLMKRHQTEYKKLLADLF